MKIVRGSLGMMLLALRTAPVRAQEMPKGFDLLVELGPVRQYADGGVREATPLQAAVDAGASTIIAITMAAKAAPPNAGEFTKALPILERTLETLEEDVGSNDYRSARIYQQGNSYLQAVRAYLLAQVVAPGTVQAPFGQPGSPFGSTAVTRLHEIRPATKLVEGGPGGLTFDPAAMKGMMAKGVAQAKAYFESLPPGALA